MRHTTVAARYGFGLHTFCEFPFYFDGSPLSDSKNAEVFDDITFKRKVISGKAYYYRRYLENNLYNIMDWGVFAHKEAESNSKQVDEMIDTFPQGYGAGIAFPIGEIKLSKRFVLDGKPFRLQGVNGSAFAQYNTKLIFPLGVTGIYIKRSASNHQEAIISDIMVQGSGNIDTLFDKTGELTQYASGINAEGRVRIERCTAKNFSHNGFDLWGNMEGTGTDVSGSSIIGCHALENGHDGFFAGRADGNVVKHWGCDARDNGRHGFNDDSFLGNNYYSCMAHYNKGGDFSIRDWENARSVFSGCYSESGNVKPSYFGFKTKVDGGQWGTGYVIMGTGNIEQDFKKAQYGSFTPTL